MALLCPRWEATDLNTITDSFYCSGDARPSGAKRGIGELQERPALDCEAAHCANYPALSLAEPS